MDKFKRALIYRVFLARGRTFLKSIFIIELGGNINLIVTFEWRMILMSVERGRDNLFLFTWVLNLEAIITIIT